MKIKKNLFLKLFTVLFLFILISCGSSLERPKSNTDYKNIIGNPIKIENLEVAQYDFPEPMKWDVAKKACLSLGNVWRLPNKNELYILCLNQELIGGFKESVYWSSSETNITNAWNINFIYGIQDSIYTKNAVSYVRAVRSL